MNRSCYYCGSVNIVKNGRTYYGKARGRCKDCSRQFVFERRNGSLSREQKRRIELLLLERISLEGICRVMEIAACHLYRYMDELYGEVPQDLNAQVACKAEINLRCYECESDELWSFVGFKGNKQWLWVAQDRRSRQIVALHLGDSGATGAKGLWEEVPERYRRQATFFTDEWEAYKKVIPAARHVAAANKKETNHAERFFCTLRHRCARLVRKSLSFSKRLERHLMAIRFFVANYNLSLLL
ncbi:IS1 family transposase [Pontibacter saemangeumensis]|uniref:IS1 family transposase n=1 Tax=Pontibacter saemangeumensis TaxID=1084525 RepID=A0ABP8LCF4_9BACT